MAVRGTCLLFDTPLKEALFDVVEFTAYDRLRSGKGASLAAIYADLRAAGVEVDLPTVGEIYNEVLPRDNALFDSEMEIDDYVGRTYQQTIDRLANLENMVGEQTIDEMAPETAVANFIVKGLSANLQVDERSKSAMKTLQDALQKGVQRQLGKLNKKARPAMTMEELITEALGWDQIGEMDLNGRLNSMSDIFAAMKNELAKASEQIRDSADPAIVESYNEYIKNLENASYTVLFRTKDALQVRNDAMKKAGFGKTLRNGKTILDWNKMASEIGSVADIRSNVEKVFAELGYAPEVVNRLKDSLEDEFKDMRAEIMDKSQNELLRREKSADRPYTPQKSDLKRLIELYHLGVFNGTHDQLIYDTIGVSDLQQEDLYDIQQLTKVASDLSRRVSTPTDKGGYGLFNDVFASREFQRIQRHIDNIINRNRNNQTRLLKALSWIKNFLDVMLSSLLSMPPTLIQNILSGAQAVMTGIRFQFDEYWGKRTAQAFDIYKAMLKHVGSTGQAYGEEIGSFATQELFVNSLKWKWKDASVVDKAKSLLYAAVTPIRIGLLAFDSANKVALTNKVFFNAIYNSLLERGFTKQASIDFMNVMLYGKSFEDAKVMAKDIIEKNNALLDPKFRSKASQAEIITLANDIVKANLNNEEAIGNDVLEAALKSSYHVAGLGLGHEPNNPLSRGIKNVRDWSKRRQDEYASTKQWDKLAGQKMIDLFVNGFMIRFTGGATNWIVLRLKSLGFGLLTGGLKMRFGSGKIKWDSPSSLREDIKDREDARNDMARTLVAAAYTGVSYLVGYGVTSIVNTGGEEEDKRLKQLNAKKNKTDKDREEIMRLEQNSSVYQMIKNNISSSKFFRATAPDAMLIHYYINTSPDQKVFTGLLNYASRTYAGNEKFSWSGKMVGAVVLNARGDKAGAQGLLASIAGDQFSIPLWKPYKEYLRLATNPFKAAAGLPMTPAEGYKPPTEWRDGLFGGGVLEELGIYKRNSKITMLTGVGPAAYERFKKKGITNINDLKGEWWKMKDSDGRILDADDAFKARKQFEKIKNEQ